MPVVLIVNYYAASCNALLQRFCNLYHGWWIWVTCRNNILHESLQFWSQQTKNASSNRTLYFLCYRRFTSPRILVQDNESSPLAISSKTNIKKVWKTLRTILYKLLPNDPSAMSYDCNQYYIACQTIRIVERVTVY